MISSKNLPSRQRNLFNPIPKSCYYCCILLQRRLVTTRGLTSGSLLLLLVESCKGEKKDKLVNKKKILTYWMGVDPLRNGRGSIPSLLQYVWQQGACLLAGTVVWTRPCVQNPFLRFDFVKTWQVKRFEADALYGGRWYLVVEVCEMARCVHLEVYNTSCEFQWQISSFDM